MWQVWVFLAPLCPICQDYTYYLNALHEQWSAAENPQVELVGWFPNPTVTDEAIAEFADRYAVEWEMARDTVGWSEAVGARFTPEAALVSPDGEVVYRGRVVDTWLPMQSFPRGHHQQSFVLDALQSGTYFYRLTTSDGLVRSHTVQVVD